MGAESAGKGPTQRAALTPSDSFAQLLAARDTICQYLEKSRALGDMLNESNKRLQNVHERLSPVRRALAPLQAQSKVAEGLSKRIDETLEPAMSVLQMFNVVKKIRVRLMREPKDDFDGYVNALAELDEPLDYLKENSIVAVKYLQEAVTYLNQTGSTDTARLKRLNESLATLKSQQAGGTYGLDGGLLVTALGKLEKEFKRLLVEESRPIDLPEQIAPQEGETPTSSSELDYMIGYPPEVVRRMQVIITKLAGTAHYNRCIEAYQETRAALCDESLQALDISYMENITPKSVDAIPWDDLQEMIQKWTEQLEVVVKMLYAGERRLARQVFKNMGQSVWVETLRDLAAPKINLFFRFGESVAASERSPEKLCKLLQMYESMEKCEHSVIQVFDGQACGEIRLRYRELLKQVVYVAGKTFLGINDWLKVQQENLAPDGRVMRLCSYVVNYLGYVLGLFPDNLGKVVRLAQKWEAAGAQEEELAQGMARILKTLEELVEAKANEYHDPALRHIFLMNNMYYIRNRAKNSVLGPLLGDDWVSDIGRKVSENTLMYRREGWQRVLKHLNREGLQGSSSSSKSGSRDLVRQRVRAFTTAFDETILAQSKWVIPDQDLRDPTIAAISQMVVLAYRSFLDHFRPLLEGRLSRDSDKYIKYSPEVLESMIDGLFTYGK